MYGNLTLRGWPESDLSALSCLVEVTGDLRVQMAGDTELVEMELTSLVRVGGELALPEVTRNTSLVSFPVLERTGRFFLDGMADCTLETLSLPALERVDGTFGIYACSASTRSMHRSSTAWVHSSSTTWIRS